MKMFNPCLILYLILCHTAQAEESIPPLIKKPEGPAQITLEKLWETSEAQFKQPESTYYESVQQAIYVSNIDGDPTTVDGQGFISRLSLQGKVVNQEWIKGLNAPKGMASYEEYLYVSDIDKLVQINIAEAKIVNQFPATGAVFLNDVAIDGAGTVYVSDMMTDTIYRLVNGKLEVWLKTQNLESPNGLTVQGNDLIVASWGIRTDGFNTSSPGHLLKISINNLSMQSYGSNKPLGNLDGVELDWDGNAYVSDWAIGKVFRVPANGEPSEILSLEPGTADIGFVADRGMLLVPLMNSGKVIAYSVITPEVTQQNPPNAAK